MTPAELAAELRQLNGQSDALSRAKWRALMCSLSSKIPDLIESAAKVEAAETAVRVYEGTHVVNGTWADPYEIARLLCERAKAIDELRAALSAMCEKGGAA